ncbi:MAG TPA: PilZ domain-containing protein [Thermotogota bacterium]|nr:PilZ domain-containing protein [Thermotogota bacterium]HRW93143.1 PilZ domain-containing protein [Thermotogota bacterium]
MGYFNTKIPVEETIKIGKPLILDVSDPELKGIYKSSVFDLDFQKNVAKIGMPSNKGVFVPLPAKTRVYVKMIDKSSLYVFQSTVISYEKDPEGFLVMFISLPSFVRKIQRRQFVRVPFSQKGKLIRLADEKEYPFITKDLSAGGLLIVTQNRMEGAEKVAVFLDIAEEITLENVRCTIVRRERIEKVHVWAYGLQFNTLPRALEDHIVRYVFQLEQQRRRKGMGEEMG